MTEPKDSAADAAAGGRAGSDRARRRSDCRIPSRRGRSGRHRAEAEAAALAANEGESRTS